MTEICKVVVKYNDDTQVKYILNFTDAQRFIKFHIDHYYYDNDHDDGKELKSISRYIPNKSFYDLNSEKERPENSVQSENENEVVVFLCDGWKKQKIFARTKSGQQFGKRHLNFFNRNVSKITKFTIIA